MKTNIAEVLNTQVHNSYSIENSIKSAWSNIAPFWPLKSLVAANPLAGFEHFSFKNALNQAQVYFQNPQLPSSMQQVNKESIKWLQIVLDTGQATIGVPNKHLGLLNCIRPLLMFDNRVNGATLPNKQWLKSLPKNPTEIINIILKQLAIPHHQHTQFLTLMLTTLPGWASHIQYQASWSTQTKHQHTTHCDYLAFRLILIYLIWPKAKNLITWHEQALNAANTSKLYNKLSQQEHHYQRDLLKQLKASPSQISNTPPDAQLVFCIDVRSEPFRKSLEAYGNYETYGFAGFFGVPVSIENTLTHHSHASCPVLLKPAYHIVESTQHSNSWFKKVHTTLTYFKRAYKNLKYAFATPFSLAEGAGLFSGIWMAIKSVAPSVAHIFKLGNTNINAANMFTTQNISNIPLNQQVTYAASALKMMGLTQHFSPLVVMCAHNSTTHNNAYSAALNCGACGGHDGTPNAKILTSILNTPDVRIKLKEHGIHIPNSTYFLAATHNTTTDDVQLYTHTAPQEMLPHIKKLHTSLQLAKQNNSLLRAGNMNINATLSTAPKLTHKRSQDWAQVRPEWGLAKNASFIIGPRHLTQNINLSGRSFLHSYNWEYDQDNSSLTSILTAPVIVAQWINAQYFFSTIDNIAFGSGSKATQNITGKIGIMQGNGSDLMHGLPLQSVFKSDTSTYHEALRLTVVVCAPKENICSIIRVHNKLHTLLKNEWIYIVCQDPLTHQHYHLSSTLTWELYN